jgi:hypothetical protein
MATVAQGIGGNKKLSGELQGAGQIFRQGETGARVGGGEVMPDQSSPTGYSRILRDHLGNVIGSQPTEPSSSNLLGMGPQAGPFVQGQGRLKGTEAAATAAQGLIPIIDPNSNQVIGYAPKGGVANATGAGRQGVQDAMHGGLTPAPTGLTRSGAQGAQTLEAMISNNILPALTQADQAGVIGPGEGHVQDFLLHHIGDPDPAAANLAATLNAVGPMLGRMYGFRSAEYANAQEQFLNTQMTPEALRAYLQGVTAHAQTVEQQGGVRNQGAKQTTESEGEVLGTTTKPDGIWGMNGKNYRVKGGLVYAQ